MRWSLALSLAVGLLALTLAIKVVALGRPEPQEDIAGYLVAVSADLRADGFEATIDPRQFVVAERGACRMKVRDMQPMGVLRTTYERLGADFGPSRYAWRGAWRDPPPKYGPLLHYYIQRELARIGVTIPRPSITSVAAGPACRNVSPALFDQAIRLR